ncbi:MAG: YdcF family protein [bacterium]|nr:YdcF family protein [bacterium]
MSKLALVFAYGQDALGELLPQTKARCECAFAHYYMGWIDKIYLTCAVAKNGILISDKMKEYLIKLGIKERDIGVIPQGSNTAGEIDTFLTLHPRTEDKIIAVSTLYHLPRIKYLFWTRGIQAEVIGTWSGTSWTDLRIEPFKMLNSLVRPFASSKKVV